MGQERDPTVVQVQVGGDGPSALDPGWRHEQSQGLPVPTNLIGLLQNVILPWGDGESGKSALESSFSRSSGFSRGSAL